MLFYSCVLFALFRLVRFATKIFALSVRFIFISDCYLLCLLKSTIPLIARDVRFFISDDSFVLKYLVKFVEGKAALYMYYTF